MENNNLQQRFEALLVEIGLDDVRANSEAFPRVGGKVEITSLIDLFTTRLHMLRIAGSSLAYQANKNPGAFKEALEERDHEGHLIRSLFYVPGGVETTVGALAQIQQDISNAVRSLSEHDRIHDRHPVRWIFVEVTRHNPKGIPLNPYCTKSLDMAFSLDHAREMHRMLESRVRRHVTRGGEQSVYFCWRIDVDGIHAEPVDVWRKETDLAKFNQSLNDAY